jgi:hypothetical protein
MEREIYYQFILIILFYLSYSISYRWIDIDES